MSANRWRRALAAGGREALASRGAGGARSASKGFTEKEYARLLDTAHTQLARPVVLVWDNLNAHVSGVIAELVAARDWLTVYRLPPYAHELNPVEPVWSVLKDLWPTWSNTTSAS
jgi:putative transposase